MLHVLLSLIVVFCVQAHPGPTPGPDEAQIRRIVACQVSAWNAGDAKAYSVRFADDGSFTNARGIVSYGHRAFEDRHAATFGAHFKGSRLTMTIDRIRFVRPDVAIVDLETELSDLQEAPPLMRLGADGRLRTRLQEVFVKDRGEWWITAYHNVDVKQP